MVASAGWRAVSALAHCAVVATATSPAPNREVEFTVFMFVPETSVSCFEAARPEYWLFVALSPVFVPLVFPMTVRFASVTYLLLDESAISAVVASAPEVTSPFVS